MNETQKRINAEKRSSALDFISGLASEDPKFVDYISKMTSIYMNHRREKDVSKSNQLLVNTVDPVDVNSRIKPHFITVYRYIRPDVDACISQNLYGITLRFDINYNNGLTKVSWAICNGDNFDKSVGRAYASENQDGSNVLFMWTKEIERFKGAVPAFLNTLELDTEKKLRRYVTGDVNYFDLQRRLMNIMSKHAEVEKN